jgi:hypothetical protein
VGFTVKILEFCSICRKDTPIYYRRVYKGVASIELFPGKNTNANIEFSIEMKPTGAKEVAVTLNDAVDYPLVPLMRELKAYILELDKKGGLPL